MLVNKIFKAGLLVTSLIAAASFATIAHAEGKRIAFFVSDLSNVFHQSQATEAKNYGKEKYGAEIVVFDGKADSAVMTQNVDQVAAGAFDGASLHIWDAEAAKPGVEEALGEKIAMTSFFSPLADTGIPTASRDRCCIPISCRVKTLHRDSSRQTGRKPDFCCGSVQRTP